MLAAIAFPVWNDSCVNSSTIVLSSRYYFLCASCRVWVVLPIEYHFCCTFVILLLFNLSFWTICPKAALLFFVHERTKKRAFMLLHINALTLFYYKIVLAVVPYKLEFVTPSNWNLSLHQTGSFVFTQCLNLFFFQSLLNPTKRLRCNPQICSHIMLFYRFTYHRIHFFKMNISLCGILYKKSIFPIYFIA